MTPTLHLRFIEREPLPGLAPTHRCPACGALWRQCDDASWNLRSASCCGLCDAGRVELLTDDAETHLAAAMRDAARIAPPSDDKAILDALKRRGIWLAQIGGSDE